MPGACTPPSQGRQACVYQAVAAPTGRVTFTVVLSGAPLRPFSVEVTLAGKQKSGRQVTFSTDLIYDVLRRHQPDHLLLACARSDAATGLIDVARLGLMLSRIKGHIRHADLEHLSPFSVPILLELGKERTPGQAGDMILAEAEADLIAEAMS